MLKDLINTFSNYLEVERRYSPHTVLSYRTDLNQFNAFLVTYFNDLTLKEIKHIHVRSWMAHLSESKINNRSINRKLSAIRSFFNYHKRTCKGLINPVAKIQSPKTGKAIPKFIQEKHIERLFDTVDNDDFLDNQARLIIELFYTTGMRRSELINLKDESVDWSNRQIKVLGKGSKERLIPISDTLSGKIKHHISNKSDHFSEIKPESFLFLTPKGRKAYPKYIYNLVKKYLSAITPVDTKSPHILRHSFATHLMNGGADLNAVKKLLGHSNLAATQVYTHNSFEKLREIYRNAHPKSR